MRLGFCRIAFAALLIPAVASAEVAPQSGADERRLTPEQIEAVLATAAAKREAAAKAELEPTATEAPPPQIHGEVGFSIGTGGYREAFGTAIYPMGDDGFAAISLDFVDWGRRHYPR